LPFQKATREQRKLQAEEARGKVVETLSGREGSLGGLNQRVISRRQDAGVWGEPVGETSHGVGDTANGILGDTEDQRAGLDLIVKGGKPCQRVGKVFSEVSRKHSPAIVKKN
jgi:hypothetical protein